MVRREEGGGGGRRRRRGKETGTDKEEGMKRLTRRYGKRDADQEREERSI